MGVAAGLMIAMAGPVRAEDEAPNPAHAQEEAPEPAAKTAPITFSLKYTGDSVGVVSGGVERGARYVDMLVASADLDLDRMAGWKGATAHFDVTNTLGQQPSVLANSSLGVNGDEVSHDRTRLTQAWVQQTVGRAQFLVGFYDLNIGIIAHDLGGDFQQFQRQVNPVGASRHRHLPD